MNIDISQLILFGLFLALSGVFSSTETAFTAVNRVRLKQQFEKTHPKKTDDIDALLEQPSKLITAILIGNNFCNVACSALATTLFLDAFQQLNISNFAIVMPITTIIITILLLIFGEITPKTMALAQPERTAMFAVQLVRPLLFCLYPIIVIFDRFGQFIARAFRRDATQSPKSMNLDELKLMVNIGRDDGVIEDDKNKMLTSIFEFSDTIVREIMTPRTDTICISDQETVQHAIHVIIHEGHSRIPVYEEKMDNIIGIIYAKDLLTVSKSATQQPLRKFMRPAVFIPEYKPVDSLLQQMKRSKFHMAIIVDEHGGMSGIVTLEDIVEEIIGDIQDEYDSDEKKECVEISTDVFDVDAKMTIRDLEDVLNIEFPDDEDYDTLGGLVLSIKGSFPSKGEMIPYKNLQIVVKEIKKRRIIRLEITKQVPDNTP